MNIPLVGKLTLEPEYGRYRSEPIAVPVLNGKLCQLIINGYTEDKQQDDFHTAIKNFLSIEPKVLKDAERYIFQYYTDCFNNWGSQVDDYVAIKSAADVWQHIRLGTRPRIGRRPYGDRGIYVSLECNCDWEEEHGLEIVFKNGLSINKIGAYDGHFTHSDAFADSTLENVIYPLTR